FLPAHLAAATAHSIAVAIAFAIITAAEIVFGELTPKWIALERPEATAIWLVKPLEIFMRAMSPFIRVVHGTAQGVIRMLGFSGADHRAMVHSEEELKMLVTASQEAGVLEEQEEQMLHRVFGFADLTAGQVMIPRTELVAVPAATPVPELVERIAAGRHSRLPVYRGDLDDVVGEVPGEASAVSRIRTRPDGTCEVDGLALVADVNAQFGLHIDEGTFTTIGGYVLGRLGRRARVGDIVEVEARRIRVEALDGLRVAKVWVSKPAKKNAAEETRDGQP